MAIKVYFGIDAFGRIDDGRGGYSATRFFHIYYLPLIPVGGVRGVQVPGGAELAVSAPLRAASVGLAYFKWIGFLAAAGLVALAYNAVESPPGTGGFLLGAAAIALFAAVISSWVWIGDDKATRRARIMSVVVPILLAGGVLGWATKERLERQALPSYQFGLRMHDYQAAHPGTSELDYAFERLGAVVAAEKGPAPPGRSCGSFTVGYWEGRDIMAAERGWLERLVASRGRERDNARDWLASRPLRDLDGTYPEVAVFSLSERPYLAVLSLHGDTDVHVYDLIEGAYACGTRFAAPPSPPVDYLNALSKAIDQITPQLHVEYSRDEAHID